MKAKRPKKRWIISSNADYEDFLRDHWSEITGVQVQYEKLGANSFYGALDEVLYANGVEVNDEVDTTAVEDMVMTGREIFRGRGRYR